eukprot:Sspe_Gene.107255::Locus_85358_Transcript_1_1_Confidence_1.000_Length_685::g.107255::m.107255
MCPMPSIRCFGRRCGRRRGAAAACTGTPAGSQRAQETLDMSSNFAETIRNSLVVTVVGIRSIGMSRTAVVVVVVPMAVVVAVVVRDLRPHLVLEPIHNTPRCCRVIVVAVVVGVVVVV